MVKYTHEQAKEAAERFNHVYGCLTTLADTDFPSDSELTNYSFVGVHVDGHCVCSFSSEEHFVALRKLAYLITQTDQDLAQEESIIENIKDTPGGVRELSGPVNQEEGYHYIGTVSVWTQNGIETR